ncbi:hypothetical protein A2U01_0103477, partial [Trifolium medium]|nr:hypothetical protein [Trifolium medium]
ERMARRAGLLEGCIKNSRMLARRAEQIARRASAKSI